MKGQENHSIVILSSLLLFIPGVLPNGRTLVGWQITTDLVLYCSTARRQMDCIAKSNFFGVRLLILLLLYFVCPPLNDLWRKETGNPWDSQFYWNIYSVFLALWSLVSSFLFHFQSPTHTRASSPPKILILNNTHPSIRFIDPVSTVHVHPSIHPTIRLSIHSTGNSFIRCWLWLAAGRPVPGRTRRPTTQFSAHVTHTHALSV